MAEKESKVYEAPFVHYPTEDAVSKLAEKLKFDLTKDQIKEYKKAIDHVLLEASEVCTLPKKVPVVKYPRTPGYRPDKEENPYNAWYYKTEIKGATEGKLKGYRVAIKDSIEVAGVPMNCGSHLLDGFVPQYDATVVTRTLDAGGVVTGKSSCEDCCYSGNSFTCINGQILNPNNPTKAAGGSSSGSAALLAAGDVDLAVGGDQGGSIRIPACWCGIVGLKPTYGLVPYTGAMSMARRLDHLGPMARNVTDCALFLEVLAGADEFDSRQTPFYKPPCYSEKVEESISGLKIGLLKEGFAVCDKNVQDVVRNAANLLKSSGAVVEEVSIPLHSKAGSVFCVLCVEEVYHGGFENPACEVGASGFNDTSLHDHLRRAWNEKRNDCSSTVKLMAFVSEYCKENYGRHFVAEAENVASRMKDEYNKALEKYDVILMPTLPSVAPDLYKENTNLKDTVEEALGMTKNTAIFDATGHPSLTLSVGKSGGLPVGAMICGRHFDEVTVFKVARQLEKNNAT